MAYLATTAVDTAGVIDAIQAFANTTGFITEFHGNAPDGRRMLQLSGGGLSDYVHFFDSTDDTIVYSMRSITLASGQNWDSQTDKSFHSGANLVHTGPYANLYLFAETGANAYIHCVVERTAGIFRHLGVGEIIKTGTWTGGAYSYGNYWSMSTSRASNPFSFDHGRPFDPQGDAANNGRTSSMRCDDCDDTPHDISGVDNRYLGTYYQETSRFDAGAWYSSQGVSMGYTRSVGGHDDLSSPNYFNNRVILAPFGCWVDRAAGFRTYIGEPPAIRAASIEPYTPGEEFSIATDTWKIFPLVRKGFFSQEESSLNLGIAYKKVT